MRGVVDFESDADSRVGPLELAEQLGDDDGRRAGRGAERKRSREVALALRGDLVDHLLLEREQPLRAAVEPRAGLGRLDPPPGAVEELRAETLLERAHLERDRRLGDAELLRRLGERAPLDDCAECRELPRVHKRILSMRGAPRRSDA